MKRNLITYFLMTVLFAGIAHSGPRKDLPLDPRTSVIKAQVPLEENNIQAFFWNTGVFNQDLRTTNTPGFYWPIRNRPCCNFYNRTFDLRLLPGQFKSIYGFL